MNGKSGCKPEIQYPCRWHYRLIGENRAAILEAIHSLVDVTTCVIDEGNVSSGGRYLSLNLEMTVVDEAERLRFYQLFAENSAIRVVL
jgi:putative lipoic acid-binding regulatory protein